LGYYPPLPIKPDDTNGMAVAIDRVDLGNLVSRSTGGPSTRRKVPANRKEFVLSNSNDAEIDFSFEFFNIYKIYVVRPQAPSLLTYATIEKGTGVEGYKFWISRNTEIQRAATRPSVGRVARDNGATLSGKGVENLRQLNKYVGRKQCKSSEGVEDLRECQRMVLIAAQPDNCR
jgi:hypothetical protein